MSSNSMVTVPIDPVMLNRVKVGKEAVLEIFFGNRDGMLAVHGDGHVTIYPDDDTKPITIQLNELIHRKQRGKRK